MSHWTERASRSLLDPLDPRDVPLPTSLDRRWLWRLEQQLVLGPASQQQLAQDLNQYLTESCEHHWLDYTGPCCEPHTEGCWPSFRQCLWCGQVEGDFDYGEAS